MRCRLRCLPVFAAFCAAAQPVAVLGPGPSVERQLAGGESHEYQLPLADGQFAGLTVEQRGIDVLIQVLDTAGSVIAEFDSEPRKQGREFAGVVADSAQEYRLRIKPVYSRQAAGRYAVRLSEVRASTDQDRAAFDSHKLATQAFARQDRGAYDEAIQLFERALEQAQKPDVPDAAYAGELYYRIGALKRLKGDYPGALRCFESAARNDQKALGRESPQAATALRGWGNVYLSTAEYAKAEPLLQESLEITERTLGPEHPNVALSLRLLGNLHGYLEDLDRSRTYLQRALAIAEKTFDPDDVSLIAMVHDLGDVYRVMGEYDRAEPLLERTVTFVEKKYGPEHIQLASPLHNLGNVAYERKEYTRALELYERAHAIREKILGTEHPDTVRILTSIADVYLIQGDYPKALKVHQRALDLLTTSVGPYHRSTTNALEGIARTYLLLGDLPRSIQFQARYDEALEKAMGWSLAVGSDREKLAHLAWIGTQTDRTVSLHVLHAPDNPAARNLAALVVLQRKGRALDAMSGSMAALRQRLNAEDRRVLDELQETNAALANLELAGPVKISRAAWEKQLADLEERRERLESDVSGRSSEFRAQSSSITLADVRAAIPREAALVEFALYRPFHPEIKENDAERKSHYVAYVMRSEGDIQWQDLGLADEINKELAAFREALRDSHRRDTRELARAVDRRIMEPVRALAGDAKRLLISPEGDLNLIPFEALVDEQGRYLLERYSISYLTTGRDLLRMRVTRTSRGGPVLLADPWFGEPLIAHAAAADRRRGIAAGADLSTVYFTPLAGTAEEARSIQALFPDAVMLTGRQASKASLKRLEAPSILHIATHGFFLGEAAGAPADGTRSIRANVKIENPLLRSGLALAGANLSRGSDDGVLTALEASGLNLWGTKVVTLSACETGLGEVKQGEGVYGLRRAFFLAGAQTLVMSLWPVNDRVTRETMTAYYTGLKQGLGRGEALRQAQLTMLRRKDRQHPFYWAGFITSGDWRSLDGK